MERIKYCKFYKGENEFPKSLLSKTQYAFLFWEAELMFCSGSIETEREFVKILLDARIDASITTVPTFLIACLFVTYNKKSDYDLYTSAAYFNKFVFPTYLELTSK